MHLSAVLLPGVLADGYVPMALAALAAPKGVTIDGQPRDRCAAVYRTGDLYRRARNTIGNSGVA